MLTVQERGSLKRLLGEKVTVGGDILLALSREHHTPMLLNAIFRLNNGF
ncbi:DUF4431 domain-containing protein [Serratia sp. UGAL515B_01]|nr:DUF4431 domain-containing protein [Serratia sp. UGAL515B_01]WON78962.1 DUF4431 domain-containing protein [Serratia sp. UGAL515B_01]